MKVKIDLRRKAMKESRTGGDKPTADDAMMVISFALRSYLLERGFRTEDLEPDAEFPTERVESGATVYRADSVPIERYLGRLRLAKCLLNDTIEAEIVKRSPAKHNRKFVTKP